MNFQINKKKFLVENVANVPMKEEPKEKITNDFIDDEPKPPKSVPQRANNVSLIDLEENIDVNISQVPTLQAG